MKENVEMKRNVYNLYQPIEQEVRGFLCIK